MAPRRRIPQALLGRPFTVAQAKAAGVSPETLRGQGFQRLSQRVYVSADVRLDHAMRCRAALLEVPRGVLSHPSAVLAFRLPLAPHELRPVRPHVSTAAALRSTYHAILVNHVEAVPAAQVTQTAWGPTTSPARTFVDRAIWLPLDDLVPLGEAMLGRRLATLDDLEAMVGWAHGRRGVHRAREALRLLCSGAPSLAEIS